MENITLERICVIRVASLLWERPDIKQLIRQLFHRELRDLEEIKNRYFPDVNNQTVDTERQDEVDELIKTRITNPSFLSPFSDPYEKFQVIIYAVLQLLKSLPLPLEIKIYSQDIVKEMGEKLYYWIDHVTGGLDFNLNLGFEFTETIYWTPSGDIDESKITKGWINDGRFENKLPSWKVLILTVYQNAEVDIISYYFPEIEKCMQERLENFNLNDYNDKVYVLMALNISLFIKTRSFNFTPDLPIFIPQVMFKICASAHYPKAAYYFWNMIKDSIDEPFLMEINQIFRKQIESRPGFKNRFPETKPKVYRSAETIIWWINQLPIPHRHKFLQKNVVELFCTIFPLWLYKEFISQLIDNYFANLSIHGYDRILNLIVSLMTRGNALAFLKMKYYYMVFTKIFKGMPLLLKLEFLRKNAVSLVRQILMHCFSLNVLSPCHSNIILQLSNDSELRPSMPYYTHILIFIIQQIWSARDDDQKIKYFNTIFEKIFFSMSESERNRFLQINAVELVREMLPSLLFRDLIFQSIENFFSGLSASKYYLILSRVLSLIQGNKADHNKKKYFLEIFEKIIGGLSDDLKKEILTNYFCEISFEKLIKDIDTDKNCIKILCH